MESGSRAKTPEPPILSTDCLVDWLPLEKCAPKTTAAPESLSRALGALKRKGLVEEDGPRLRLLDRDRLEALAEMGKDAG